MSAASGGMLCEPCPEDKSPHPYLTVGPCGHPLGACPLCDGLVCVECSEHFGGTDG